MLKEFKEFAMRGNVLDMAIGIIIGAAFGKIVASLVSDILMPPLGKLLGNINFSNFFITLSEGSFETLEAAKQAGAVTINYGIFLSAIVDFVIIAFAIFLLVKQVNKFKKKQETVAEPVTKSCSFCFTTIPIQATRCPNCTSTLAK